MGLHRRGEQSFGESAQARGLQSGRDHLLEEISETISAAGPGNKSYENMNTSVVIPTLNEKDNLEKLLPQLRVFGKADCGRRPLSYIESGMYEVLVCDNGSDDGTVEVARGMGATVLGAMDGEGRTVGHAVLRGIGAARFERIVVMDGDLSHPVSVVWRIAMGLAGKEMVIGSRYKDRGSNGDRFANRVMSRAGNILAIGLAPKVGDRMSGVWGMTAGVRDRAIGVRPTAKPMLEYLVRGKPRDVEEIGYVFEPRKVGKSKIGRKGVLGRSLKDLGHLYRARFGRLAKFCVVGGSGVVINYTVTIGLTELVGMWYGFSLLVAIGLAAAWNFTLNDKWTWRDRN